MKRLVAKKPKSSTTSQATPAAKRSSAKAAAPAPKKAAASARKAAPKPTGKSRAGKAGASKTAAAKTPKSAASKPKPAAKTPKSAASKPKPAAKTPKTAASKPKPAAKATKSAAKSPAKKTTARGGGRRETPAPSRRAQPGARPARRTRPAKLDARALADVRTRLLREREELVRQRTELEEDSFIGTQSDLTGEVGLDEDFADAGTATFDRERDLSIQNNIRDLIEQIDRALERIEDKSYGTCERCGQPIDAARLKALPHAGLCLDCKRREERVR